jgi:RNA-directed DNA polymerase
VDTRSEEPTRYVGGAVAGAEADTTTRVWTKAEPSGLMEAVCERGNLWLAYERVMLFPTLFRAAVTG